MRPLVLLAGSILFLGSALPGAGPPPAVPAAVKKLIEQLGDDDVNVRKQATKKLAEFDEDWLPVMEKLAKSHPDVDVRLRLLVAARAIRERNWGLIRAMGLGAAIKVRPPGDGYWLNRIRFSSDGKYAVAAGGGLILYDLATGKEAGRVLEVGGARPALAVSRDGKYVLTGHAAQTAFHLVNLPSLKTVQTFTGHTSPLRAVDLSPDGSQAVSVGQDGTMRLWDVKTGKQLAAAADPAAPPWCAAFSPDGKQVLFGQTSNLPSKQVKLWDVETRKVLRTFTGHTGTVLRTAFLPDGKTGVSVSSNGTLRVWDLESGKEVRKMSHGGTVNDLAVSLDGKRALTAGFSDRRVKVWDLTTGKLVHVFDGHVGAVLGVAFSRDGRQALSCDSVCCVRLWRVGW